MTAPEPGQLSFDHQCLAVLDGYAVREAVARAADSEWTGWLDRLTEVNGLAPTELTSIHGWLIAQGLLRFEFNGRSVGLQYQLSPAGRDAVQRKSLMGFDELRAVESAA